MKEKVTTYVRKVDISSLREKRNQIQQQNTSIYPFENVNITWSLFNLTHKIIIDLCETELNTENSSLLVQKNVRTIKIWLLLVNVVEKCNGIG